VENSENVVRSHWEEAENGEDSMRSH